MKVASPTRRSMRRHLLVAVVVVCILVIGGGGWGTTAVISGAVVASESLVVDSNVKKVQHPTGGIVGELRVRDGDHVHAGDIVVRRGDGQRAQAFQPAQDGAQRPEGAAQGAGRAAWRGNRRSHGTAEFKVKRNFARRARAGRRA